MYELSFDFTSQAQAKILKELQDDDAFLVGYFGTGQADTAYLPAALATPFGDLFGKVNISVDAESLVVYVNVQDSLSAGEVVVMDAQSQTVPLGTSLVLNADGSFSVGSSQAPAGTIQVLSHAAHTVILGLAMPVNGETQPFSAVICHPQGLATLNGPETGYLFASFTPATLGALANEAPAPGCSFQLGSPADATFAIAADTFAVYGTDQTITTSVTAGSAL